MEELAGQERLKKSFVLDVPVTGYEHFIKSKKKKSFFHSSIVNWAEFLNHKTVHIHREIIYPVWLTKQSTRYLIYVTSEEKPESICISLLSCQNKVPQPGGFNCGNYS